jgi:alpha-D-ribose 1-methylphosphonate 5-triphosphate synthase subunit PhnL
MPQPMIRVEGLDKTFTLHTQGGIVLPVLKDVSLSVDKGECVVLHGPSGAGKSTLLRSLYGNYLPQAGHIFVMHEGRPVDLMGTTPHIILQVRRRTIGHVSQFLRAIPRVPTIDIVAEPLRAVGVEPETARRRAANLLRRLRIPRRMWSLAPATFSGGEQQRVNLARGFALAYPILLLDEPTAALDAENRRTVIELIGEAKARGAAIVGIFHDREVREAVADRTFAMQAYETAA